MDKALVIYDMKGTILSILYGATQENVPQGVPFVWCDIPPGAVLDHVDTTTGQVVFEYEPESDLGRMQANIAAIQEIANSAQVAAASAYTEAQQAYAEAQNNYAAFNDTAAEMQNSINSAMLAANDAASNAEFAVATASAANELAESNSSDITSLQGTVELNALTADNAASINSADITDLQIGLTEVFEMLLGV